ncbi:MAG: DNA-processing protein DprA [Burkholderiaceae bacterium]
MAPTPSDNTPAWPLWLRLLRVPGLGPARIKRVYLAMQMDGAVEAGALTQGPDALQNNPLLGLRYGLSAAQCRAFGDHSPEWQHTLDQTQRWLAQGETRFIVTLGEPDYPPQLMDISDPPTLLFGEGCRGLLTAPPALAIVGSRNPSAQGLRNANRFAATAAESGLTIVSGMALGIDGAAHAGALSVAAQTGPNTMAVLGTGIDVVYPRQHQQLAGDIAEQGLLLSEFVLGAGPQRMHFPRRNRLIAGLALGTLIVEAAPASGSLITAQMAVDMGREVFAIPGSIHVTQSKGCHLLIKQGAKLVESVADILDDLPPLPPRPNRTSRPSRPNSTAEAADDVLHPGLCQHMGFDPLSLDDLLSRTQWDVASLQVALFELALAGRVARMPGGLFQQLA